TALQEPRWPHHRAPHVGYWAVVEAQTFFWLAEVAAEDVLEVFKLHHDVRVERVQIVDRDQPTGHVPLVLERFFVGGLYVRLWLVVRTEVADVLLGIRVADRLVWV